MDGFEGGTKEKGTVIQMGWNQRVEKDGSAVGSEGWAQAVYTVYIYVSMETCREDVLISLWMERSADGTRVLLKAYCRTKLGSVPSYLWDINAFDCRRIRPIQESNSSVFPMLRWCSWTHSDRHPRNWNYLRICESLWRAVVATCKSKHPWQSNPT